jgi:CubicO group peptidase (beta-lactamase class C family)
LPTATWSGKLRCAAPDLNDNESFFDMSNDSSSQPDLGWYMGAPSTALDPQALTAERMRARFSAMRATSPTVHVWRGGGPASAMPRALRDDLDALSFTPLGASAPMRWDASLRHNHTDGLVVLHRGQLVYEWFDGPLQPHGTHVCHSVTKSLVGTLASAAVADGLLDPAAPVTQYVPELAGSAWATATVRQTMDMTTALHYDEDYTKPEAGVWTYLRAAGQLPGMPLTGADAPRGIRAFLRTVRASGEHGQAFAYKTVNTDVLGWIVCRVLDAPLERLVAQRFWGPMGAAEDGYFVCDATGWAGAGGALNVALHDLARFGETMRCDGWFNGRRIVPAQAVADIRGGARQENFAKAGYALLPGWSYRAMWWVTHNAHGAYMARGIHGQNIYIDPKAEMVIARFASFPRAASAFTDPTTLPAYHAMALHLMSTQ